MILWAFEIAFLSIKYRTTEDANNVLKLESQYFFMMHHFGNAYPKDNYFVQ